MSKDATFETVIAGQVGIIMANLEQIMDLNPALPQVVRRRLAVVIGKCHPMATVEYLTRLRVACDGDGTAATVAKVVTE